jgi:hypothetical protein
MISALAAPPSFHIQPRLAGDAALHDPAGLPTPESASPSNEVCSLGCANPGGNDGEDKPGADNPDNLTDEEEAQVRALQKRDAEVHQHEAAHATVGGPFAGAPSYEYQRGPDGRLYAVGGEVKVDVTPAGSPESTIHKAEIIKRAALAPAEPSSADRAAAAAAEQLKQQAEADLKDQKKEEAAEKDARDNGDDGATTGAPAINDLLQAVQSYAQAGTLLGGGAPQQSALTLLTA